MLLGSARLCQLSSLFARMCTTALSGKLVVVVVCVYACVLCGNYRQCACVCVCVALLLKPQGMTPL